MQQENMSREMICKIKSCKTTFGGLKQKVGELHNQAQWGAPTQPPHSLIPSLLNILFFEKTPLTERGTLTSYCIVV